MRLVFHPEVYSDIDAIMRYYEQVATPELADRFYAELCYFMTKAAETPESFSLRERDIRRVNLKGSLTIFYFVSSVIASEFWSSAITAENRLWGRSVAEDSNRLR
jgi:hypothetical protein